jgi:D-3-phosphoglycerate dehydrogenase
LSPPSVREDMTDGNERWRVLIPEPVDESGPESIADIAEVVGPDAHPDDAARREDVGRFDAIVVRTFEVDRALLERAEQLKVIAKHGAGLDNVDIEAATDHGVVVCNTPDVNAPSVAEHAVTLVLAVRKRVRVADTDVRGGAWDRTKYISHELAGDTLGLFGCGSIGARVAELLGAFGMDVLVFDPYLTEETAPSGVELVDSSATLFERADVVSVHAPLTDETRGAIGRAELAAFEDGVLVNTARGGIVDEDALASALADGTLAGAGLDVFESEPPDPDHPLFEFENVLATPHVAGTTVEAMERMSLGAAENVRTVYEGRLPETTVNADGLDAWE